MELVDKYLIESWWTNTVVVLVDKYCSGAVGQILDREQAPTLRSLSHHASNHASCAYQLNQH